MIKLRLEWQGVKEGAKFGRLTVLGPQFRVRISSEITLYYCVCRCKCGTVVATTPYRLQRMDQ